jgi:hypothetical protein
MISRTRGTPIIKEITIMKTAGRLFSKIEFITAVALTALVLVIVVGSGLAALLLEIPCKALVVLVNAAVAFSKALVVFSNLSLTISAITPVAFVLLVNPFVVIVTGSVALGPGEENVATAFSEDKLSMNNTDRRITTVTVFIYTLFVLFIA